MSNDVSLICPRCGHELKTTAPAGLCPNCLMAMNLATPTEILGESGPHGTKVIKPPPALDEIARHFPQFEILGCLGRGGMGVVYKARQPKLNRVVALKVLAPEKVADAKFAERFEREAQALARLNHPNIVTVYDFGQADSLYYLLMEFVDGVSLRQLLQTRKIGPEEALAIVPKICEALQFAHEQGVVHRDIKPENLLLDKQGRLKIADFGIAKIAAGLPLTPGRVGKPANSLGTGTLTQDHILGTPNYMAPEQLEHPQSVDHRADIYSLGVVFYEMLTGELPLPKFQPPSQKVQVDVRLDQIVSHALEKEPARRYQQISEVKSDVETITATKNSIVGSLSGGTARYALQHASSAELGMRVVIVGIAIAIMVTALATKPAPGFVVPIIIFSLLSIVVAKLGTVAPAKRLPGSRMTADAWIVVAVGLVGGGGLLSIALVQRTNSVSLRIADSMSASDLGHSFQAQAAAFPTMLDLSPFYRERFVTASKTNRDFGSLVGEQIYDGLPFRVEGRGYVYGRKQAEAGGKGAGDAPDFMDIRVERVFDELHLLHGTRWPDVDGETIAFIRLNYADGSSQNLPIRYGVHVRDWLRLPSEEDETLSDPNSKVVFRAPPGTSQFKSTARLVKTMLLNPQPEKVVSTMDVISARHHAAYDLVAATVVQRGSTRPTTRRFAGAIAIRVLDGATGQPIKDALTEPSLNVEGAYVISRPLYSAADGSAVIRYPLDQVDRVFVSVEKEGYKRTFSNWSGSNIPTEFTFRLERTPTSTVTAGKAGSSSPD